MDGVAMDSIMFDAGLPDETPHNNNSQCLVCGSGQLANYLDLSLDSSRTTHTDTPIDRKLRDILVDSSIRSSDSTLCLPCFHLVDRFDALETQLDAIRKELTDKYGFARPRQTAPPPKKKKKRRPYARRKKPTHDQSDGYMPPDNVVVLNQQSERSLNVPLMETMDAGMVWPTESVQLQELATNAGGWKNAGGEGVKVPAIVYDPSFLNPGERLRVGAELEEINGVVSYACGHCDIVAPNVDALKCHVGSRHLPKVLTASIPPELGLGGAMNCGVQLADVAKPFACVFCDAAFKFKSNLNLHFREKHTPHKPFACVECGEGFRRSMELSRHKVYYCPRGKKNLSLCRDGKTNGYNS